MSTVEHVLAIIGGLGILVIFVLIVAAVFFQEDEDDGWNPFE